MIPMTASRPIQGAQSSAAFGRTGRAIRMKPYVPSFSMIAARSTEPTVGASVWASGSQVWNGNIGTLIAKPRNSPAKIRFCVLATRSPPPSGRERRDLERADLEEQRQERQQHQRRAEQREQEELDRRVLAVRPAPDADHEEHRQQDELEEDEEEDEVLGAEGADHARLEQEHQRQERLRVVRLGEVVPGVDDAADGDERGEQDQRERDPVDAQVVPGVDDVDPVLVDRELQRARARRSRSGRRWRCSRRTSPAWRGGRRP